MFLSGIAANMIMFPAHAAPSAKAAIQQERDLAVPSTTQPVHPTLLLGRKTSRKLRRRLNQTRTLRIASKLLMARAAGAKYSA